MIIIANHYSNSKSPDTSKNHTKTGEEKIEAKIPRLILQGIKHKQLAEEYVRKRQTTKAAKHYAEAAKMLAKGIAETSQASEIELWKTEAEKCLQQSQRLQMKPRDRIEEATEEVYNAMKRCIITPDRSLSEKDIIGHRLVRRVLERNIVLPRQNPSLSERIKIVRNIMLYGPPGVGKTLLMKILANKDDWTVFNPSISDLISKWQGESQDRIKILYKVAWEYAPSLILMDEFDGIFGVNGTSRGDDNMSVLLMQMQRELAQCLEGIKSPKGFETLTVVATNHPEMINGALERRFGLRLFLPPPTQDDIQDFIQIQLQKNPSTLTDEGIMWLWDLLEGYTLGEIEEVFTQAVLLSEEQAQAKVTSLELAEAANFIKPQQWNVNKKGVSVRYYCGYNKNYGKPEIPYYAPYWINNTQGERKQNYYPNQIYDRGVDPQKLSDQVENRYVYRTAPM